MQAKKALGQNFLRSQAALKRIVDAADITPEENVLEIGPGQGVLTQELLLRAHHIIAIEKDRDLIPLLSEKFKTEIERNKLTLINADIRDVPLSKLGLKPGAYKVVANIPYYITGEILRSFLSSAIFPERMTLLVQDDVAKRIAKDTKESILSISVKVFGRPRYVAKIPRGAFAPTPKVDSAVLNIEDISRKNFADADEALFFKLLRAGFSSKRKQLVGNLKKFAPREKLLELFARLRLSEKARAEDVGLETWLALAKAL